MKTEEDTFIKLAKPSYEEIYNRVANIDDSVWFAMLDSEIDALFKSWHWTYREYANETIKRIN